MRMCRGPTLIDSLGFLRFSRSLFCFLLGPALTLKVTGVPEATSAPAAGLVDTTVPAGKGARVLRAPAAPRPASERERNASRALKPDKSGTATVGWSWRFVRRVQPRLIPSNAVTSTVIKIHPTR